MNARIRAGGKSGIFDIRATATISPAAAISPAAMTSSPLDPTTAEQLRRNMQVSDKS